MRSPEDPRIPLLQGGEYVKGAHPNFPGSGASFSAFGAWMDHSGFLVQEDRSIPIEGVPANVRWSIAGGDLTRSRPLGNDG